MSNNSEEIVVGANGRVLVANAADVTLWPDDVTDTSGDSLDPAFQEVGFVTEDGVTFADGKTINDIKAWQSFYPVRKNVTEKSSKIDFVMRQWNPLTVVTAFGGGAVDNSTGVSIYTPPVPGTLDELAIIVEWVDGDDTYRLVMPRGVVTGEVSSKVTRTDAADLPISFEASPAGSPDSSDLGTQPWYILTDADQFGSGS